MIQVFWTGTLAMDQNSVELQAKEILKLLKEKHVSTIVLSGKSGTGKTWMARKVGLLAVTNERVDIMLWISLSVRHDEMSLYEHIARQLSLLSTSAELEIDDIEQVRNDNGKEETLDDLKGKVQKKLSASNVLRGILVILDDEGNKMKEGDRDLQQVLQFIRQNAYQPSIEVADGDGQQKLKVLITSRNEDTRHQTRGDKEVIDMKRLTPEMSISLLKQGAVAKVFEISGVEILVKSFIDKKEGLTPGEVALLANLLNYHQHDSKVQDLQQALEEAWGGDDYNYTLLLSSGYERVSDGILVDFSWQGRHFFRDHGSIHYGELISYWILEGYLSPFNSLEEAYEEGHRILMQLMYCQMLKEVSDDFLQMVSGTVLINYHRQGYGGIANLGLANVLVNGNDWHGIGKVTLMDGMIRTLVNHKKVQPLKVLLLDGSCLSGQHLNSLLLNNQELQILGLFSLRIKLSLPRCFCHLKKLNVLVLGDCDFLEKIDEIGELTTLTVLEVSGSSLVKSMPKNFFQHLKKLRSLHFSDFQIEVMPDSFYHLTELSWLILKRFSHLTKLQSLKKCQNLMVVDLSGAASLPTFPEKNLKSLPKLQTLNLSNSKIKPLPIFRETGELTHLSVSGCSNMDRVPSIRSLTNLQVLDLSWSTIVEFHDKSFQNNTSLKILDLSGTAIPSLPFNIGKPREFYLKNCSETKYMNCVESSEELEILDFSGACNLVKIEGKFFECLENLRVLNLSGTKVKDLPSLSALHNLRQLLLSCCLNLEKLPRLASSKLEELDLSGCKAMTMIEDKSFEHLPRLRRLVLSQTKIVHLPELNSLSNLEELNLSGVKSFTGTDFIEHMSKLQVLNLSETLLKELPALTNLKSLKHLFLRGCGQLEVLPVLEVLHNLETLDLSQTALRQLPFVGSLSNLHKLLLSDCSKLENFKNHKLLDMSGVENLPCGISRLTQLQHLALPSMKEDIQAADTSEVTSWKQKPSASHWSFSVVDRTVPNTSRSLLSYNGSLFLEFLDSNPSVLDSTSNHFHLFVHPTEVQNGARDMLFQRDELVFRDVYLLTRHCSKSQGRLVEIHHLSAFSEGIEAVLHNAEYIFLFDSLFFKSFSDLGAGNVKTLKGCWIEGCENMEFIIETSDLVDSSERGIALEILWISNASSLRSMYSENLRLGSFQNLKCLYLDCCPKLSSVFFSSQLLQMLEILHVRFCENLVALFGDDVEEHELPNLRTLRLWELPKLKSIGCIMPSLQSLEVVECPMLGHMLSSRHVPEKLDVLKVRNCSELGKLLEGLTSENCKLPHLAEVHLWGLPKLTRIGIESPLLRSLELGFCGNLEAIFVGMTSENFILQSLHTVHLWGLPKLVGIGARLPPLQKYIIRDCPKLALPVS
nr:putative disease resistance protein At4g19050 [Coffea arabica]